MTAALLALYLIGASPSGSTVETPPTVSARNVTRGRLRAAGRRTPVAAARILAVPAAPDAPVGPLDPAEHLDASAAPPAWVERAETDDEGRFVLDHPAATRLRLIIIAPGFARVEQIVDVSRSEARALVVFVPPDDATAMRTIVQTKTPALPEQVSSTVMESEEIRTAPGTQGDPLRALQNLPGVARTPGGFGLLILRGSSPNQSRVFLGGHALPRAFHSLALASVVPAAAIDRMEFVPSNFGARYGDATGGLVVLHPTKPDRDGVHGHGRLDLLGMGASVQGPAGEGAYYVAAQRGWVDVDGTFRAAGDCRSTLVERSNAYQRPFRDEIEGPLILPNADESPPEVPGCVDVDVIGDGSTPTFTEVQERVFRPWCSFSSCHGDGGAGGLMLERADDLVGVPSSFVDMPRVSAGDPENSYLYQLLSKCEPEVDGFEARHMPAGAPTLLDPALVRLVRAWIESGAPS